MAADRFELLERWLETLLCGTIFDAENVMGAARALEVEARVQRSDQTKLCSVLLNQLNCRNGKRQFELIKEAKSACIADYEDYFCEPLVLQRFHSELIKAIDGSDETRALIFADLEALRQQLVCSQKMSLHIFCDPKKLKSASEITFDKLQQRRSPILGSEKIAVSGDLA